MPRYRAEVVFRFGATAPTDGGRRLRELSSAAESVGFSLKAANRLVPTTRIWLGHDGHARANPFTIRRVA